MPSISTLDSETETAMQARAMRSQIYLPVLRFGITDEDWGVVIAAAITGYTIPFLFGMKLVGLPLELVGWLVTMGVSVFILNILRRKARPAWLWHAMQARISSSVSRRRLPGNSTMRWLKN